MGKLDVIGEKKIVLNFRKLIENDKLSHSYIFEGEEGQGKKTLSQYIASIILCQSKEDTPCGECSSCLKILSGNHPDILMYKPEKQEYTVEQSQKIQEEMRKKPNESNKKIVILTEGERLSVPFQNKFLKLLEEPPEHSIVFILVSSIDFLLKTTVSRCQRVKMERLSSKEIERYIKNNYDDVDDLKFILKFSDGNLGKTKRLIENAEFSEQRKKTIEKIGDVFSGNEIRAIESVEYFTDSSENIANIVDIMIVWIRDLIIIRKTKSYKYVVNTDEKEKLKEHVAKIKVEKMYRDIDLLESIKKNIKDNINYQLSIEYMVRKLMEDC